MEIVINATLVDRKPTGLGIYSENVIRELQRLLQPSDRATVLSSVQIESQRASVCYARTSKLLEPCHGKKAALARFIWAQFVLPFRVPAGAILYSPTHHGLLWHGRRQVVTVHDLLPLKFPRQYRLQYRYFTYVVPRLLRIASTVIADSENTRNDIELHYGIPRAKIRVVYSGVDHLLRTVNDRVQQGEIQKKYKLGEYVLAVGATYPHKNLIRAVEAFARLQGDLPDLQLAIIGAGGPYLERVKHRARDLNLHNVRFLGYVASDELAQLYRAARALLYPSLYEGFGLPPLEAMVCGCPVIAANTSSLPEVCGDAAYYIDPHSVDDIARGLYLVASSESRQDDLRQKGAIRGRLFTWKRTAKDIYAVLEKTAQA